MHHQIPHFINWGFPFYKKKKGNLNIHEGQHNFINEREVGIYILNRNKTVA
jgi:hypothetical protein